ncbi:hypothetical protein CLOSTMETH_02940 [[Clostridium] methylpentosum DSM 5476]|uniref:Uncharacterized protein n=1 Tax=[Clostridium] methylpentosum DSM 5476 TaxID=537013 RepID=C0EGE8_9FIRM|nr:hypothetical protein CLOSTMETH_02940 [[Clostridium] methylpentosum DSM 5476]
MTTAITAATARFNENFDLFFILSLLIVLSHILAKQQAPSPTMAQLPFSIIADLMNKTGLIWLNSRHFL